MSMIDSRCGLKCSSCSFRQPCNCGGCIDTMGNPFHGKCPIADCCQKKGQEHCGECGNIPCEKLFEYSYLDREHGDIPQGSRIMECRKWAAETGKKVWNHVLLTSAGWSGEDGINENILNCFLGMLEQDIKTVKVLFIPTAAIDEEAKYYAGKCKEELLAAGIWEEHINTYDIGRSEALSGEAAMEYDVIYFTGGDTGYLLKKIEETGFAPIIKKMVYANKVYVGVSAGSLIATPNIGDAYDPQTAGLAFINAYLSVHNPEGTAAREDLPLPHIPLTDAQALQAGYDGYHLIE